MISTLLLALTSTQAQAQDNNENILLIIADDIGIGEIHAYDHTGMATGAPPTPAIDRLAASGVTFDNTWSNPLCSPTRAGIYTGKKAQDHGVGGALSANSVGLDGTQMTLGDVVDADSVGLFGKWHLGDADQPGGPFRGDMPLVNGFDTHRGSLHGKPDSDWGGSSVCNYEDGGYLCWDKYIDGSPIGVPVGVETTYATFDTTEEAKYFMSVASAYSETWVAVVAYNSSHSPFHNPPPECVGGPPAVTPRDRYQKMTRCLDAQVDDLLDHLEAIDELENTTVIFVGDNGTPEDVGNGYYDHPLVDHWKGSVYQGGIHVPLIIADGHHLRWLTAEGSAAPGEFSLPSSVIGTQESDGLVHTRDLFNTIREITGLSPIFAGDVDSKSMVPYLDGTAIGSLRTHVFTESKQGGTCNRAIRNGQYKVIRQGSTDTVYDLLAPDGHKERSPIAAPYPAGVVAMINILNGMGC